MKKHKEKRLRQLEGRDKGVMDEDETDSSEMRRPASQEVESSAREGTTERTIEHPGSRRRVESFLKRQEEARREREAKVEKRREIERAKQAAKWVPGPDGSWAPHSPEPTVMICFLLCTIGANSSWKWAAACLPSNLHGERGWQILACLPRRSNQRLSILDSEFKGEKRKKERKRERKKTIIKSIYDSYNLESPTLCLRRDNVWRVDPYASIYHGGRMRSSGVRLRHSRPLQR